MWLVDSNKEGSSDISSPSMSVPERLRVFVCIVLNLAQDLTILCVTHACTGYLLWKSEGWGYRALDI